MVRFYGDKEERFTATKLPTKVLADIGRLIRAFAEIEDLITLYICQLAEINQSRALVLLGKAAITRRLDMAKYLAQMTGPEITAEHTKIFNSGFRDALECRNCVAHGVLLGKTSDGRYAFLTDKTVPTNIESAIQVAISYDAHSIWAYAKVAEQAIPQIEKRLKLQELRAERLQRPLLPHRKAQPRRQPSAKPSRPPQS